MVSSLITTLYIFSLFAFSRGMEKTGQSSDCSVLHRGYLRENATVVPSTDDPYLIGGIPNPLVPLRCPVTVFLRTKKRGFRR